MSTSNLTIHTAKPLELSRDLASHISAEFWLDVEQHDYENAYLQTKFKHPRKKQPRPIDISDFRVPKPSRLFSEPSCHGHRFPAHRDGFDDLEVRPTGRVIPVKRPACLQNYYGKLTTRVRELTIVTERSSNEESKPTRLHGVIT